MLRNYTLEYWIDDDWYVGKIKEVPGVFSQGETLTELEENIKDAFNLMIKDDEEIIINKKSFEKQIEVEI